MRVKVKVDGFQCERCGYQWLPKTSNRNKDYLPTICPKCKSPYWNKKPSMHPPK